MMPGALLVGLLTLGVGIGASLLLGMLPSVRLQLAGLALVAVALPLGAVILSGTVMFHMGARAEVVAVAGSAGAAGVIGALLLARSIARRIDRVRRASVRLAAGELSERAPVSGPVELAELATSFNAMADHLEQTFGARRELVAWASHDLRAPITSLQAMLEAIEDGVVEPTHYLTALQGQVRLLGALVDDLFELARIDAQTTSLEVRPTDLAKLADMTMKGFELEARARGIELHLELPDGQAVALCAADKVERVLTNLVTNSLRYTPTSGRVTLSLIPTSTDVMVCLEDTGVGIAADSVERVFEPFYRADPARSPGQGSAGLGLAIARGLIDIQGGRIWAETPIGGGARISFILPTPASSEPAGLPAARRAS